MAKRGQIPLGNGTLSTMAVVGKAKLLLPSPSLRGRKRIDVNAGTWGHSISNQVTKLLPRPLQFSWLLLTDQSSTKQVTQPPPRGRLMPEQSHTSERLLPTGGVVLRGQGAPWMTYRRGEGCVQAETSFMLPLKSGSDLPFLTSVSPLYQETWAKSPGCCSK